MHPRQETVALEGERHGAARARTLLPSNQKRYGKIYYCTLCTSVSVLKVELCSNNGCGGYKRLHAKLSMHKHSPRSAAQLDEMH